MKKLGKILLLIVVAILAILFLTPFGKGVRDGFSSTAASPNVMLEKARQDSMK